VASTTTDEASAVASTASEKRQEVVGAATGEVRQVTGTVKDQASRVSDEVAEQGRNLAEETKGHIEQQAYAQSLRLADTLSGVADEVLALVEGRPGGAQNLQPYLSSAADTVYDTADRVYDLASDLQTRGLTGVVDDLQSFARRRPGVFLMGAAALGFGVGRIMRAGSSGGDNASAVIDPGTDPSDASGVRGRGAPDVAAGRASAARAARGG
jgi:hypothetical protein